MFRVGVWVRVLTYHYPDIDEQLAELWKALAFAARYGHQQLPTLMAMTSQRLLAFNNGVSYWIQKENAGTGGFNRADGGG